MIGAKKVIFKQPALTIDPNSFATFYNNNQLSKITIPTVTLDEKPFTVEAKIRLHTSKSGDHTILGANDAPFSTRTALHIVIRNMRPHMGFYGNDYHAGDEVLVTNTWYRLVFIYAHTDPKIKVIFNNGTYVGQTGSDSLLGTQPLTIGVWGVDNNQFEGDTAYLRVWDKALSSEEIASYDNQIISTPVTNLLVNYNFSGNVLDFSGNAYHGSGVTNIIYGTL